MMSTGVRGEHGGPEMSGLLASLVLIGGLIIFLAILLFLIGVALYFMDRMGSR
jgi:hypothetical protein